MDAVSCAGSKSSSCCTPGKIKIKIKTKLKTHCHSPKGWARDWQHPWVGKSGLGVYEFTFFVCEFTLFVCEFTFFVCVPPGIPRTGHRWGDPAPPDRGAPAEQHGAQAGTCPQDQVTGRKISSPRTRDNV